MHTLNGIGHADEYFSLLLVGVNQVLDSPPESMTT
jgi:hypothetical protein